jgi:poly(A) polymerase
MIRDKYTPTHPPINLDEPKQSDLKIDESLKGYMDEYMKLETDEEMARRQQVLIKVEQIFLAWVRTVAVELLHMPEDEAQAAGGKLFVSGSHKLGVREPGADIDTVCVAPNFCTREHFFTLLKEDFKTHPSVTEFNSIETAQVPVMSFDFDNVSIDLLFARMSDNVVPENLDILDDTILDGLDDATEKSLNGPRVTMMIHELVGKSTFPNFLIVLRCVRRCVLINKLYHFFELNFWYLDGRKREGFTVTSWVIWVVLTVTSLWHSYVSCILVLPHLRY